MNFEVRSHGLDLCLPPQAAGTYSSVLRKLSDTFKAFAYKCVACILPRKDRSQLKAGWQFRGHILQAVHRKVDAIFRQRLFNLFGKHTLGTDLRQSHIQYLVASGFDDLDLDLVGMRAKQCRNMIRLPKRKLRAARSDAQSRHQFWPLAFFSPLSVFSGRLKMRRMASISVVGSDSRLAALFIAVMGVCMTLLMMPRVIASTASSCSGFNAPSRPRTLSTSAWRIVSKWSCKETIVGTTASVCSRSSKRCTSSSMMSSAFSASSRRPAACEEITFCRSSMS